jgi:glycosyltransferase involved in cell wall biosynthesis
MPSDRGNGLAMRAGFFLDAYSRRSTVDLVVAPVAGGGEASAFVRSRVDRLVILDVARPDSHYALLTSIRDPSARLEAFRRYGRPSLTSFAGPACRTLASLAAENRYSAVHISRLYIAELAGPWLGQGGDRPRLVLDCDENDALAYRRIASMQRRGDATAAAWAEAEAGAFAAFASSWLSKFDLVLAASHTEARSLSAFGVRALAIPNVVAAAPIIRPSRRRDYHSVLFVGTLSYAPNADAVTWFVSRVWHRLARVLHHRVRLVIVGANPPPAIARLDSKRGMEVTGAVADVSAYYRQADLVVAPLRAGGGTRIKMIEAAARGVPVVATAFAAEGTTFQHRLDILIANNETSFLRSCLLLARNRSLASRLAERARMRVKRDYSPAYWRNRVANLIT